MKPKLPRTTDAMGTYLRKVAKTPLLSRDDEAAIAEKVCRMVPHVPYPAPGERHALRIVLAAARKAVAHKFRIDHVVDVQWPIRRAASGLRSPPCGRESVATGPAEKPPGSADRR